MQIAEKKLWQKKRIIAKDGTIILKCPNKSEAWLDVVVVVVVIGLVVEIVVVVVFVVGVVVVLSIDTFRGKIYSRASQ